MVIEGEDKPFPVTYTDLLNLGVSLFHELSSLHLNSHHAGVVIQMN